MMESLLYLAVGAVVWLVLYGGFFAWLDHMVRRGIEDPAIPRYVGMTRERSETAWKSPRRASSESLVLPAEPFSDRPRTDGRARRPARRMYGYDEQRHRSV
jgi:hypothetical protein